MSVISQCPECSCKVAVPEALLGKRVRCTKCQGIFVVGPPADESPSPPPSRSPSPEYRDEAPTGFRDRPVERPRSRYEDEGPGGSSASEDEIDDRRDGGVRRDERCAGKTCGHQRGDEQRPHSGRHA